MDNPAFDLILHGAQVYDGLGSRPSVIDVALKGDRIVAMGTLDPGAAAQRLDLNGLALAPGFIDSHTHDDGAVLHHPHCLPKLSQGITTVVTGCCGLSLAPLLGDRAHPLPFRLLAEAEAFRYPTFAAYRAAIEATQPGVNVAALVGQSALRAAVLDDLSVPATPAQRRVIRTRLEEALADGAAGLSTGVYYAPSQAATEDEMAELAQALPSGAPCSCHIRDEHDGVIPALEEALRVGRRAGCRLIISHHKTGGASNWGRTQETLGLLDATQDVEVYQDAYPYTAGSSVLDPELADTVQIWVTWSDPYPSMGGQPLEQVAAAWGCSRRKAAQRLSPAGAVYFQMDEADVRRVLAHPRTMIGSDGLPRDPRPHPRLWGALPRFLGRYCRDLGLMPLEEGIRRITSLPAKVYNLTDRGTVRPGAFADLVIFDPGTLLDQATYQDSTLPSTGIHTVFVNGQPAFQNRQAIGRSGRFLPRT